MQPGARPLPHRHLQGGGLRTDAETREVDARHDPATGAVPRLPLPGVETVVERPPVQGADLAPEHVVERQIGGDGPPYFPLARAIVSGLTFSTVITLLILPLIYLLLDDLRNWGTALFRGAAGRAKEPLRRKLVTKSAE